MSDPINFAIGVIWAAVLLISWTASFKADIREWRERHDGRNFRALLAGFAEWMTAAMFASALFASVVVDVGTTGLTVRGFLFTMGLGMFTGSGVLSALEKRGRRP